MSVSGDAKVHFLQEEYRALLAQFPGLHSLEGRIQSESAHGFVAGLEVRGDAASRKEAEQILRRCKRIVVSLNDLSGDTEVKIRDIAENLGKIIHRDRSSIGNSLIGEITQFATSYQATLRKYVEGERRVAHGATEIASETDAPKLSFVSDHPGKIGEHCDNFFETPLFNHYTKQLVGHYGSLLTDKPEARLLLENLEGSSDLLKDLPSFGFTPENLQNPELIQMVESIQQLSKLIQSTVSGDSKNNRIYFESIKGVMRDIANRVMSLQGEIPLPLRKYVEFFKQFNAALLVDIEMADLLFDQLKGVHTDVAEADQIGDDKVFLDWLPDQENKLSGNLHGTPEIKERVDPLLMGNQPFFITDLSLKGDRSCRLIRMPAITVDTSRHEGKVTCEISPEVRLYLDSLRDQGKKHVYINLMIKSGGSERTRSLEIEKLDQERDEIAVISLDKNSDFYRQRNAFEGRNHAATFMTAFKDHLLGVTPDGRKRFYWPKELDRDQLIEFIDEMIPRVHEQYFGKKDSLTVVERQDFIEQSYFRLIDYVMQEMEPDSANISCKICCDRGGAALASYLQWRQLQPGTSLVSDRKLYTTLYFGSAFMVSDRTPQSERVARAVSALKRELG